MTIAAKLQTLAAIKAAQYEAIIAKGGTLTAGDWGAYAAAIAALPSGGDVIVSPIPAIIYTMPFEAGDEPTGGTVWYVKPGGTGDQNGTSWDHAFATRQQAVNAASYGDQIRVWEGTYYLDAVQTPKAGVSEYYGFNDDGTWATRQPFTHPSKLDARFTAYNYENATVTFLDEQVLDGLWLQNVIKTGDGGHFNKKSYLRNCIFANNNSCGAYLNGGHATNCIFANNNGGGAYLNSSGDATNCIFANNSSSQGGGGAFLNGGRATNCIFANNSGSQGGGAYLSNGGSATNCTFVNNRATGGNGTGGGGAFVSGSATNCIFANNSATNQGGGAYVVGSATNCFFANNSGAQGGGAYLINSGASATNCTCAMNKAITGDSFYLVNGNQRLYNCASWGGNIYLAQDNYAYKIYNCASNFALAGVTNWDTNADVQGFLALTGFPFAALGLAPFDAEGAFYQSLPQGEEALAFIDRVVIPSLADPHLPAGSALIGAGYYEAGVTPDTDADGKARPLTPSIGAYEP
jgi:hypothetical protein